jgi:hypothetical protein
VSEVSSDAPSHAKLSELRSLLAKVEGASASRELDVALWLAVGATEEQTGSARFHTGLALSPLERVNGRTMAEAVQMFPGDMAGIARAWEVPRLSASLDASVAMIERVLPRMLGWKLEQTDDVFARLYLPEDSYWGVGATVATAACAACLKALIAQEEERS